MVETMKLMPVPLSRIQIQDSFWSKHTELVEKVMIPRQWTIMTDQDPCVESSHCLENFKIAAGKKEGDFYGAVFQDTDIAKWLEAVGYSLAVHKNTELEETADEVIELIAEAQQPDGYLDTYFITKAPDQKWKNLCEGHELYTAGHMIEAAVAYYEGTGKRRFLDCTRKLADLICDTFGCEEGKIHGYPGHQEIEIGLIRLALATGERKYMDQAKYFLDIRGVGENYFLTERQQPGYASLFPEFADYDPAYSQSHKPVREQETAEGHAVRAVYMYSAMADIADAYQDEEMLEACRKLWNNIVNKRMYVTGGIGSSGFLERFTTDYDLPNDCNYSETCASIGMAMFSLRMANITRESQYADIAELQLYNTILAGAALDGQSFFYVNPLEVRPQNCMPHTSRSHVKAVRQKWFGVACCPPNVARTLASLGKYIYGVAKHEIYMHLYISNETQLSFDQGDITLITKSEMPWNGKARIRILGVQSSLLLALRIPEYAENYRIYTREHEIHPDIQNGYAKILVEHDLDITIQFDIRVRFLRANRNISFDTGRAAVKRGPVVYCFEEADNGKNLSSIYLFTDRPVQEYYVDKLGGIVELEIPGKKMKNHTEHLYEEYVPDFDDIVCKAVPYAYWNNRGTGEMAVWMHTVMFCP